MQWPMALGARATRREIHERLGGRLQGGISPSRVEPVILLFAYNIRRGPLRDGWAADGCFHFVGEGQSGDQRMAQGNLAIANHRADGRAVHLFRQVGGESALQQYVGEFELDHEMPWYESDAVGVDGAARSVIVFRLRPLGDTPSHGAQVPYVPVSQVRVESQRIRSVDDIVTGRRSHSDATSETEADLLEDFGAHLLAQGNTVGSFRIVPPGENQALRVDLFDETNRMLFDVRGSTNRDAVRKAVGGLLDARRFFTPSPRLGLVLPAQPRPDLIDYCTSVGIEVFWRQGKEFASSNTAK